MKFRTTLTKRVAAELTKKGLSPIIHAMVRPSWELYESERGEICAWDRNCKSRFICTGFAWRGGKIILRKELKRLGVAFKFVETIL